MNLSSAEFSILLPAFIAGALVTATHVPLGTQVLARGIVFIDLAIAQIAGCGVLLADQLGFEPEGIAVQVAALSAALAGALLLTWTERIWPEVQEAVIGVTFVLGATGSVLLLASNVHGSEHLRDLLVGQILWAQPSRLAWAAAVYAAVLALWFGARSRLGHIGFYTLFAVTVTVSVQLVGLYLVFATLIVPPLATRHMTRATAARRVAAGRRGLRGRTHRVDRARSAERPGDRLGAGGSGAGLQCGDAATSRHRRHTGALIVDRNAAGLTASGLTPIRNRRSATGLMNRPLRGAGHPQILTAPSQSNSQAHSLPGARSHRQAPGTGAKRFARPPFVRLSEERVSRLDMAAVVKPRASADRCQRVAARERAQAPCHCARLQAVRRALVDLEGDIERQS